MIPENPSTTHLNSVPNDSNFLWIKEIFDSLPVFVVLLSKIVTRKCQINQIELLNTNKIFLIYLGANALILLSKTRV